MQAATELKVETLEEVLKDIWNGYPYEERFKSALESYKKVNEEISETLIIQFIENFSISFSRYWERCANRGIGCPQIFVDFYKSALEQLFEGKYLVITKTLIDKTIAIENNNPKCNYLKQLKDTPSEVLLSLYKPSLVMVSRVLAQAYRTQTGFFATEHQQLPPEYLVEIASLVNDNIFSKEQASSIAYRNFNRPDCLQITFKQLVAFIKSISNSYSYSGSDLDLTVAKKLLAYVAGNTDIAMTNQDIEVIELNAKLFDIVKQSKEVNTLFTQEKSRLESSSSCSIQ